MTLFVAVAQMPVLMVVLRSVEEEEKAFALGIQFVIFRLFGYIPSPIMFGNVIDSTCLLWKQNCEGAEGGRCLMYDIETFRYKYVGVCAGIKVGALLAKYLKNIESCYILLWCRYCPASSLASTGGSSGEDKRRRRPWRVSPWGRWSRVSSRWIKVGSLPLIPTN